MKNPKKNLITRLLVASILLLIIVGGIYFYTQVNSSAKTDSITSPITANTSEWQTYQSNLFGGITLKYPEDWSLIFSSSTNISNIKLSKDGYSLTIELCDIQNCATAVTQQTYDQNAQLSPPDRISLNIDGHQAWRTFSPIPNGEGDNTLYFNFTFLRQTIPTTSQTGFNDKTKFTPVSDWIENSGALYTMNYMLPNTVVATNFDYSIIDQMDKIVQNMTLGH